MEEEIKNEKIRRAMLAGPSIVTSDATVAEIDRQGNMTVLRPGTNDWVCIPGDQNVIGQPDMALPSGGHGLVQGYSREKAKTNEHGPGPNLHAQGRNPEKLYGPVRYDESCDPYRPALDDSLALRGKSRWSFHRDEGRGHDGDVRWYALRTPAHLRVSMGGK